MTVLVNGRPIGVIAAPMGRGKTTDISKAAGAGRKWIDTDTLADRAFTDPEGQALLQAAHAENTVEAWAKWNSFLVVVLQEELARVDPATEFLFVHSAWNLAAIIYGDAFIKDSALTDDSDDEQYNRFYRCYDAGLAAVDLFWTTADPQVLAERVEARELQAGVPEAEAKLAADVAVQNWELVYFEISMRMIVAVTEVDSISEEMAKAGTLALLADLGYVFLDKLIEEMNNE